MSGREELARKQADLLRALLAGGAPPAGFDAGRVEVEVNALRAKRRRIIAYLRPDLQAELGARFRPLFDTYAVAHPKQASTRARQDAAEFADWLADRGELTPPPKPRWWQRLPGRAVRSR